jgi:hypothetical protein
MFSICSVLSISRGYEVNFFSTACCSTACKHVPFHIMLHPTVL